MRWPAVIISLVAFALFARPQPHKVIVIVPSAPPTAALGPEVSFPGDIREQWARQLLAMPPINNSRPTAPTVALVVAWTLAEDACLAQCGYSSGFERNNPLNTTQEGFNQTVTINGDGVKGYATYDDGLAATAQTLSYGYYTEIVAGLASNDPERALRGMYASPWGTSIDNVERIWRSL